MNILTSLHFIEVASFVHILFSAERGGKQGVIIYGVVDAMVVSLRIARYPKVRIARYPV